MKSLLRTSALCALLAVAGTMGASPAQAESNATVRNAQMHLAELGYYAGRYDGVLGPVTESALEDFQRHNGLPITGKLTDRTLDRLMDASYETRHLAYRTTYQPGYYLGSLNAHPLNWDTRWRSVRSQMIPSRYAKLDITEDLQGSLRHYTVTLNGQPVLFADNQPSVMRVSQTFRLHGEDAVLFTAYHGQDLCGYKNYLLTIRANGTYTGPREIGDCSGAYNAHVANNALYITFADGYDTWRSGQIWRYENASLVHL